MVEFPTTRKVVEEEEWKIRGGGEKVGDGASDLLSSVEKGGKRRRDMNTKPEEGGGDSFPLSSNPALFLTLSSLFCVKRREEYIIPKPGGGVKSGLIDSFVSPSLFCLGGGGGGRCYSRFNFSLFGYS